VRLGDDDVADGRVIGQADRIALEARVLAVLHGGELLELLGPPGDGTAAADQLLTRLELDAAVKSRRPCRRGQDHDRLTTLRSLLRRVEAVEGPPMRTRPVRLRGRPDVPDLWLLLGLRAAGLRGRKCHRGQ
jgi:hypothetical protein